MGFRADIKSAVAGAFCALFNTDERLQRWGAGLFVSDERANILLPRSARGRFTSSGRALFCDVPPLPPFIPTAPSGQCADRYCLYVRIQATVSASGAPYDNGPNVNNSGACGYFGPLSEPYIKADQYGNLGVYVNSENQYPILTNSVGGLTNITLTPDHYRQNGQPDNCGVAPDPLPLPDADRTAPITIDNNNGDIVFGNPRLNINGDLIAPFGVKNLDIEIGGELVLNKGDINLNFGGQPTSECPITEPRTDTPPPMAEDDDPENDEKANIIGVVVVSSSSASITATEIGVDDGPNIFAPRCATVSFKIRIGNSAHWTADIPVKNKNSYIPCPGVIPAIDAYVQPEAGWISTITPVRGIVPANKVVLA